METLLCCTEHCFTVSFTALHCFSVWDNNLRKRRKISMLDFMWKIHLSCCGMSHLKYLAGWRGKGRKSWSSHKPLKTADSHKCLQERGPVIMWPFGISILCKRHWKTTAAASKPPQQPVTTSSRVVVQPSTSLFVFSLRSVSAYSIGPSSLTLWKPPSSGKTE